MNKIEAIDIFEKAYPDLKVYSIVEDSNMFIAQMVNKDGESIMGGTKGVFKDSGKTIEISPLKHKGLVRRLMNPLSLIRHSKVKK